MKSLATHGSLPLFFSLSVGARMAEPTFISGHPDFVDLDAADLGAKTLDLPFFEQGRNVARVMEAKDQLGFPLYPVVVVMMPRRSTKTTSIWNVLIGRCLTVPGYKVVTTAQDGQRARNRFREVARLLEAGGFEDDGLGKIRWSNGDEALEFANGSRLWVVAPHASNFRGEAADAILFDEAGEYDEVKSDDLMTGALPLMDTRPQGQVIVTGTPGKSRSGLLWSTLQDGRNGEPTTGIVDYSVRDSEATTNDDGSLNMELLARVHPGIGTLTTLAKIAAHFKRMDLPSFEREYFCRFPFSNETRAIDADAWTASLVEKLPPVPDNACLALDVANDGSTGSLVAAWRDEEGCAYLGLLGYDTGSRWLPKAAYDALSKRPKASLVYDPIGENLEPAKTLERERKVANRVKPASKRDLQAGQTNLINVIHSDEFKHQDQPALNTAAEGLRWRDTPNAGRWFGFAQSGVDISPLRAGAMALWAYDNKPTKGEYKHVSART